MKAFLFRQKGVVKLIDKRLMREHGVNIQTECKVTKIN